MGENCDRVLFMVSCRSLRPGLRFSVAQQITEAVHVAPYPACRGPSLYQHLPILISKTMIGLFSVSKSSQVVVERSLFSVLGLTFDTDVQHQPSSRSELADNTDTIHRAVNLPAWYRVGLSERHNPTRLFDIRGCYRIRKLIILLHARAHLPHTVNHGQP